MKTVPTTNQALGPDETCRRPARAARSSALALWVLAAVTFPSASALAQQTCNTVSGLVEVGDSRNINNDVPINDGGLVAYVEWQDFAGWFFRIADGFETLSIGPSGNWSGRTHDLNNRVSVLWSDNTNGASGPIWLRLSRNGSTQVVAASGTGGGDRFQWIGVGRLNDHDQVVFLANEILPSGFSVGVFFAEPGMPPVRVPIPPGYTLPSDLGPPPGIDNDGAIATVATLDSAPGGTRVILGGDKSGLTEWIGTDAGNRFSIDSGIAMARQGRAGPALSFVGTPYVGGVAQNRRVYLFSGGTLQSVFAVGGAITAIQEGVANENGHIAVVARINGSDWTLLHGRNGIDPVTDRVLAVGDPYPFTPTETVAAIGGLRMNSVGQLAAATSNSILGVENQVRYDPVGTTQCRPNLPDDCDPGAPPTLFCFSDMWAPPQIPGGSVAGGWADPPMALGYEYTMRDGALFTAITDFPRGFNAPFTVIADGIPIAGEFGPGESVEFDPPGVTSFIVTGISPRTDSTRGDAFPLRILANRETISFDMRAILDPPVVPALSTWGRASLLAALLLVGAALLRRRAPVGIT